MPEPQPDVRDAGVLTWPNLVTVLRFLLIPGFVVLALRHHNAAASWLLGFIGATDWVDGQLARRLNQVSTIGKIIDPIADRVLVATAVVVTVWAGAVPLWFAILTLGRELLVSLVAVGLAALGAKRIDVLFIGKAGAMALMFAYPMFLLAYGPERWQGLLRILAWILGLLGLGLSWVAVAAYVKPARVALAQGRNLT